jgi:hypothetical protein
MIFLTSEIVEADDGEVIGSGVGVVGDYKSKYQIPRCKVKGTYCTRPARDIEID